MSNPDVRKSRPIAFQEVLKKITIGIRLQRLVKVWVKHGIIHKDNYGGFAGGSVSTPLLISKMVHYLYLKW